MQNDKKLDIIQIADEKKGAFVDKFYEIYLKKSFGTFNKSELEELFIYLLSEYGNLKKLSNFQISIALQIPESRVRTIMYRSQLKYEEYSEEKIRKDFFSILVKKKYDIKPRGNNDQEIRITIEQQYLKQALEAKIKEEGDVIDGNFCKETLVLSPEAFSDLMLSFFARNEVEDIQNELQEELDKAGKNTIKDVILSFLKEKGLKIGVGALATIITGGNFTVGAIVTALLEQLK